MSEGAVVDRSPRAPGVIPAKASHYVAMALVVIVLMAVAFGGRKQAARAQEKAPAEGALQAGSADPTAALASQQRLEQEAARRRERAEYMEAARRQQTEDVAPRNYGGSHEKSAMQQEAERQAVDLRRREYASRFASSSVPLKGFEGLAGGRGAAAGGDGQRVGPGAGVAPTPPPLPAELAALDPKLLEELMRSFDENPDGMNSEVFAKLMAAQSGNSSWTRARGENAGASPAKTPASPVSRWSDRSRTLFEGTVIETVLLTRLVSEMSGPVICQVSADVYSPDRSQVLIPAGSRVLGEARQVTAQGQTRLAVVFHRLIRPDGFSTSLDRFVGLSQTGATGLHDQVDNHYLRIFGTSIALGALGGLQALGTRYGPWGGGATPADSGRLGVAGQTAQTAQTLLERYTNIPPTVTIREGTRVKVHLTQDLELPAVGLRSSVRGF